MHVLFFSFSRVRVHWKTWNMSLKGSVNRLSHDCHVDIDGGVATA